MRIVRVSGKRLGLRDVTEGDVAALHVIYGDPTVTAHLPYDPRSHEDVAGFVAEALTAAAAEPRLLYMLAVVDQEREDDDVIGVARLRVDPGYPHSAEISLGLRPDLWGRGIGTDLIRSLLGFGFRDLGLHRLWGSRSPSNTAAQLAMLVAGMVEEGRLRHHMLTPDGWRDSIIHAAVSDEWEGLRR